jgi:hypothetical protein
MLASAAEPLNNSPTSVIVLARKLSTYKDRNLHTHACTDATAQ